MILPYAHEDHRGRRWPFVTVGLIVVNVVCLIAFNAVNGAHVERITEIATQAVQFRDSHPAVRDDCAPLVRVARHAGRPSTSRALAAQADESAGANQAQYERMCKALDAAIADSPSSTFGYVPAQNNLTGLITYQFVHAGWLHLVSNLWFLWLCGVNLEDRWGRLVYLPFYLSAGVVAALAQKAFAVDAATPIVGASGAIAGAMGAFLVLFARTRIKFAYVFFLVRWGTFTAPAAVMLPLWLATELLWGMMQSSGVAHWAHVGGFVYGVAFALGMKWTGADAKLDASMEDTITKTQDARILRAGELIDAKAIDQAMTILYTVAREQPRNIDVQLELLRAAKAAGNRERERDAYAKLVHLYFDSGSPDTAVDLFGEMLALDLHREVPRGSMLRVAEMLVARSLLDRADATYTAACHEGIVDLVAVRATLAHARVLRKLGRNDRARTLLMEARESPFTQGDVAAAIDAELMSA